jgi:hypothetical protein
MAENKDDQLILGDFKNTFDDVPRQSVVHLSTCLPIEIFLGKGGKGGTVQGKEELWCRSTFSPS